MTVVEKLWMDILKVVMGVSFKPSYMLHYCTQNPLNSIKSSLNYH